MNSDSDVNIVDVVTGKVQDILDKTHNDRQRRKISVFRERINFCCPICGDSLDNNRKKRANIYWQSMSFHCFNCGYHSGVNYFLKSFDEELDTNSKLVVKDIQQSVKKFEQKSATTQSSIIFTLIDKLAIPYDIFMKKYNLVKGEDNQVAKKYIDSRGLRKYNNFAYDEKKNELYIMNLTPAGSIIGFQIRQMDKNSNKPKYMSYRLSNIYKTLFNLDLISIIDKKMNETENGKQYLMVEDGADNICDTIDKISLMYNIMNVNFNKDLTICEGPIDSMFLSNCIALCGASKMNDYFDDIPTVRYLFDNDKTGISHSIDKLKKGKKVFLWNKFLKELNMSDMQIKDINDFVLNLYKAKNANFKMDLFDSCFSDDELDSIYL